MRHLVLAALAAALTTPALAEPASDPAALRAAYGQGYWDGYAAAAGVPAFAGRSSRSAFGLSVAEPAAPVWIMPADRVAPGARLEMPALFAGDGTLRAVYFKGPWLWRGDDVAGLFHPGARGPGLDLDALGRSEALQETAELEPGVAEQIRRMRAMGINEGLVIVRATPIR